MIAPDSKRVIESRIAKLDDGRNIVDFLSGRFTYRTRDAWLCELAAGRFLLDDIACNLQTMLYTGALLRYEPPEITEPEVDCDYQVIYEDDWLLGIVKPPNLPTHPSGIFWKNTLWYLLRQRFDSVDPVNRLDTETSGLLLFSRNGATTATLAKNILEKRYQVIVHGDFPDSLSGDGFLCGDPASFVRKKRRFTRELPTDGVKIETCSTRFRRLAYHDGFSLLEATLHTGRTHQIRATLYSLGFPVVGDKLYGLDDRFFLDRIAGTLSESDRKRLILPHQALHASHLKFIHPATNQEITLAAPPPESWQCFPELTGYGASTEKKREK